MKAKFVLIMLSALLLCTLVSAQGSTEINSSGLVDFIKSNWGSLIWGLLAFIEIIVRLTPTEKDNAWFQWLFKIVEVVIPNRKKDGGLH